MPITKSAKKALRKSATNRKRNIKRQEAYKKAVKEYRKLIAAKEIDKAKTFLSKTYKTLDKAAKAGTIKKNTASRLKSRLSRKLASPKS